MTITHLADFPTALPSQAEQADENGAFYVPERLRLWYNHYDSIPAGAARQLLHEYTSTVTGIVVDVEVETPGHIGPRGELLSTDKQMVPTVTRDTRSWPQHCHQWRLAYAVRQTRAAELRAQRVAARPRCPLCQEKHAGPQPVCSGCAPVLATFTATRRVAQLDALHPGWSDRAAHYADQQGRP